MIGYKITDKNGQTRGGMQWGEGITHRASGKGKELCSDGVIHYYENPYLAVFANPIHGKYDPATMLLWEFRPKRKVNSDALKSVCKEGTTVRRVPVPVLTTEQRVTIAIKCALPVSKENKKWVKWAQNWLSGKDRTYNASYAASYAASFTSCASDAAYAAAHAACACATASDAAYAAAHAACATCAAAYGLDVVKIIREVIGT